MISQTAHVERPIAFYSAGKPAYLLEGILHIPLNVEKAPVVVLCHPQPVTSDMDDPLIKMLAQRLADMGMLALRFNFRGAGKSQGQQTDGRMEPLDLAGAIHAAISQRWANEKKVCVIGHAFGAYIALLYAPFDNSPHGATRVGTVVAVSLPLYRLASGLPKMFEGPKLFVTSEFDEVCPLHKLEPFVEQQVGGKGIKVITGARHLLRGYEEEATQAILKYMHNWVHMQGVSG